MFQDTIDIHTKGGEGMFVLSLNRFEKGEERKRRLVQSEMIFRSSMDKLSEAAGVSRVFFFFLFFIHNFIADACIRASYKRTLFLGSLCPLRSALCPGCLTARGFSLAELKHETSAIPSSVRSLGLRNASFPFRSTRARKFLSKLVRTQLKLARRNAIYR